MRSGLLRYPAHIVREVKKTTDTGAETVEYESILSTRVGIKSVSGREFIAGGAEMMETTVKIVMRYHPLQKRILAGDEVRANNKKYSIISVLDFDNERSLQLMCKELI